MNRRLEEPDFVKYWRERINTPVPKCCHTCEHLDEDGLCILYDEEPPEDFAATIEACNDWIEELPF